MVMAAKHSPILAQFFPGPLFPSQHPRAPSQCGNLRNILVDSGARSRQNKSDTGALKASGFRENPAQNFSDFLLFGICKPRSFVFLFLLSH